MIEVEDSMSSSLPMFSEGQSVEVLCDPANPNDARIKKISSLYFLPLLFRFMGFIFGGIGVGLLVSQAF